MHDGRPPRTIGPRILAYGLLILSIGPSAAWTFDTVWDPTLTERFARADVVLIAKWVDRTPAKTGRGSRTTFEVLEALRLADGGFSAGDHVEVTRSVDGKPGDRFLLIGMKDDKTFWWSPFAIPEGRLSYVTDAPPREAEASRQVSYFLKFLESEDAFIAQDAFVEIQRLPLDEVLPLARTFSADKLRAWIREPQTPPVRVGFYARLLGFIGSDDDREFLKQRILEPAKDYRLEAEGLMEGYLLLAGEEGLQVLDQAKLGKADEVFSESYAAMQAVRFMWESSDRIKKPRLLASMRLLLDRPDYADLAVNDLTRWRDCSIMGQLLRMYGDPDCSKQTKRAIIRYFWKLSEAEPTPDGPTVEDVDRAKRRLAELKSRDPETYNKVDETNK